MLQEISDQSHQVITGICIKTKMNEVLFRWFRSYFQ